MTQAQTDAELCGLIPEENEPEFVAQHLSAYAFIRPQLAGRRVLEVGFGDGYGAAYLAEGAKEVVGVDVLSGNIPRAQAKYPRPNLSFRHFDGMRLPFSEAMFDAAVSCQVIEHVPEPQLLAWVSEIKRVLRPGGRLFVSTLNLDQAKKPGRPYQKLIYHEKEFTAPELAALLKQIFPSVTLLGLHPTLKHRFFRRLKRWGFYDNLPAPVNVVRRYFSQMTIRDFTVRCSNLRHAIDLFAVCENEG